MMKETTKRRVEEVPITTFVQLVLVSAGLLGLERVSMSRDSGRAR